jgi:hypothetical protein
MYCVMALQNQDHHFQFFFFFSTEYGVRSMLLCIALACEKSNQPLCSGSVK